MVGASGSQFARRFQKLFHVTLRQYLLRVRVRAACRRLAQGEESVTEIALAVGFYDPAHVFPADGHCAAGLPETIAGDVTPAGLRPAVCSGNGLRRVDARLGQQ